MGEEVACDEVGSSERKRQFDLVGGRRAALSVQKRETWT